MIALEILHFVRARGVAWPNTSPCHGEDRGFKSLRARHPSPSLMLGLRVAYSHLKMDRVLEIMGFTPTPNLWCGGLLFTVKYDIT